MLGFYVRLPFQLATPLGFHATHIPKGNLVYIQFIYIYIYIYHHEDGRDRNPKTKLKMSLVYLTSIMTLTEHVDLDKWYHGLGARLLYNSVLVTYTWHLDHYNTLVYVLDVTV